MNVKVRFNIFDISMSFTCDYCNWKFSTNSNRLRHMKKRCSLRPRSIDNSLCNDQTINYDLPNTIGLQKEIKINKSIPAVIRKQVWDTYIGPSIGKIKCPLCQTVKSSN